MNQAARRQTKCRAGYTLIEALLATAMVGLLLTMSAKILNQAFGIHHRTVEHVMQVRGLEQLRESLLRDVESANAIELEGGILQLENETWLTRYAVEEDAEANQFCVRRRKSLSDPETRREDRWLLPVGSRLSFQVDEELEGLAGCELEGWLPDPVKWLLPMQEAPRE